MALKKGRIGVSGCGERRVPAKSASFSGSASRKEFVERPCDVTSRGEGDEVGVFAQSSVQ